MRANGYTLVELLVVLAIAAGAALIAAPTFSNLSSAMSIRSAAAEVHRNLIRCRAAAIACRANVALRYELRDGKPFFVLYRDGNANGVLANDIRRGVDRRLGVPIPWTRGDTRPGFLVGTTIPDPSDPAHALPESTDPIRFNRSDMCSFSPLGESTPGSIYLTDGRSRMAVVRVWGVTGRVRTLYFRKGDRAWTQ
jgi:prepilin-type N-terminal cleavage/methylation domain-containing protein